MNLIVVRHGLSEANARGLSSGHFDTDLTEEGKKQAEELAKRLIKHKIEQIYASPLKRSSETALPIAEQLNIPVNIDRRIMEVGFGSFEGKPNDEIEKAMGKSQRDMFNDYNYDFTPFGGESSAQVEARVKSFLEDLKKEPFETVLVVSHGGIVRWIHYIITGEKIGAQPNAEELHLQT